MFILFYGGQLEKIVAILDMKLVTGLFLKYSKMSILANVGACITTYTIRQKFAIICPTVAN